MNLLQFDEPDLIFAWICLLMKNDFDVFVERLFASRTLQSLFDERSSKWAFLKINRICVWKVPKFHIQKRTKDQFC